MLISVVIPTRNEKANIETCIRAFDAIVASGKAEVIVVDNFSTDDTAALALSCGAKVFSQGPERCAQRNRGWHEAKGDYILFVDADMIVSEEAQHEITCLIAAGYEALYVREVRSGKGWWTKARNFERSFYDATCIDGLRVIKRDFLVRVGGYDENLVACEDWDLDRRVLPLLKKVCLTKSHLIHNEKQLTFRRHLQKKRYYAGTFAAYRDKWHNDAIIQKQFGLKYRFVGVFCEKGKWRRLIRHPLLFLTILLERFAVGALFLSTVLLEKCPICKT